LAKPSVDALRDAALDAHGFRHDLWALVVADGATDAWLRVIFDNGTESNMLMRSLQRALNKDEAGRRITDPSAGPLFSDQYEADDQAGGTI
jgi:hypothetical protein